MRPSRVAADDLRIRRAEPHDHAALCRLMATPRAYAGTLQQPLPSVEQWRERLAKHDPEHFIIVAEVRDASTAGAFEVVGHLGLTTMPQQRRCHVAAIGMSIHDDWQGRGIGSALMLAALDRADRWMNILRIELTVFTDNAHAVALYRRHGFMVEGTHRAYALRDGVYVDAYAMARLHPSPPVLPTVIAS